MSEQNESRAGSKPGVVVGAAVGYGFPQVRTFLESLRARGFDGPVVLILDRKLPADELARIEAHQVTTHPVWNNSWLVVGAAAKTRLARLVLRSPVGRAVLRRRSTEQRLALQSASNRRFQLYPQIRAQLPELFDGAPWVFLSDVRDVYFQGDPSEAFADAMDRSGLHLFAEGPPPGHDQGPDGVFRIGEASSTTTWIANLSDQATADRLAQERVICSGTILLSPGVLDELCGRIVGLLDGLTPGRSTFGHDQGALDLLYYTGRLDDLDPVVHDNGTGGLATLGAVADGRGWEVVDGRVIVNGEAPPVVHQYDRVPSLKQAWSRE